MAQTVTQRAKTAAKAGKTPNKDAAVAASPDYQPGFGNYFVAEAVAGALPVGRNSPQRAPFGLYAEQISGTSFTRRARKTGGRGHTGFSRRWFTGLMCGSTTV